MENKAALSTEHIWCVIPVFNNKDTVKRIALDCRSYLSRIVVVDDGSTDVDVSSLLSGSDITVLRHEKNRGKGEAILTALKYIDSQGGRFMITIDADGQHYPRDIERFIPLLQDDEGVVVIGCRKFLPRTSGSLTDGEHIPRTSRFGRKVANFWLRLETGISCDDCQSGFRAYPVRPLTRLALKGAHYDFETEILAKAVWAGLRLVPVDIDVWYPEPHMRVSSFRPLVDNLRISWMHARLVARRLLPVPDRKLVTAGEKRFEIGMLLHPIKMLKMLLKENATPAGLAVSAAVGMFLAVLPLVSLHTPLIIYVSVRLHLNKIMAINIQHLAMPPFIPAACIELGYYLRYGHWLTDISPQVIFGQLAARLWEWVLGSLIIAPVAAVIVGLVVFIIATALQRKASSYGPGKTVPEN
ncbi:MAG: DUF2062 domain-containing protein [bacterium]